MTSNPAPTSLRRTRPGRTIIADRAATVVLWGLGIFVIVVLGAIIVHFIIASIGVVSLSFIFGNPSDTELGGIGPLIWNSFYMLFLTMAIAVPFGLLAGIYMAEYAGDNQVTNAIRFAEEAISSVPSIVVGLFGLIVFVNLTHWGFTALSGALALTMFNLPLMARLSEQALRAVPADERSASLALGATKWQSIRHVVLPLAIPGLATGIILTSGRVFGEAAALIFTAGLATPTDYNYLNFNIFDPQSPWSPLRPATTLAVYIWKTNSEGLSQYAAQIGDGSSAVLLAAVLAFNVGARFLSRRLTRRLTAA
jgi:phosphate transport system permease protein